MDDEAARHEQPGSAVKNLPMLQVCEAEDAGDAPSGRQQIASFDFEQVPLEFRGLVIGATESLRVRREKMASDAYHFGAELSVIKERLEHGLFLAWLEQAVGLNKRTAERMMQVYRRIRGKIDSVSHLTTTTLYAMTRRSVPDDVLLPLLAQSRQRKLTLNEVENALRPKAKVAPREGNNDALDLLRELIQGREDGLRDTLTAANIKGIAAFLKQLMGSSRRAPLQHARH